MNCFDTKLDELIERNIEILQLPQAPQQSVVSLLNWINSTGRRGSTSRLIRLAV